MEQIASFGQGIHLLYEVKGRYVPVKQSSHPVFNELDCLPVPQSVHNPLPVESLNVPSGHKIHDKPSALKVYPASHVNPDAAQPEFNGQLIQTVLDKLERYLPVPQATQLDLSALDSVPTEHGSHAYPFEFNLNPPLHIKPVTLQTELAGQIIQEYCESKERYVEPEVQLEHTVRREFDS